MEHRFTLMHFCVGCKCLNQHLTTRSNSQILLCIYSDNKILNVIHKVTSGASPISQGLAEQLHCVKEGLGANTGSWALLQLEVCFGWSAIVCSSGLNALGASDRGVVRKVSI